MLPPQAASPEALAELHGLIAALVDEPEYQVLAGVVAPATAPGLAAFAESFGENAMVSDIAAERWRALSLLTEPAWGGRTPHICVHQPDLDVDPTTEGVQPDCVATELHLTLISPTEFNRTEELLPRCSDSGTGPRPCWKAAWASSWCRPNELEFMVEPLHPACLPSYFLKHSFTCATRWQDSPA